MGERREVRLRPGPGRSGLSSGRRAALAVVAAAIAASVCVEVSAPVVAAAADARGFATVPATVLGDGAAVQAGVVADGRGGMYSVSRDTILGGTSILFRRSDDGGTNWSAPRIVTPRDYNWFAPSVAVRIVDDAVEVWVTAVRYECPPAGSFCGYRGGLFLLDGSGSVRESWDTPFGVAYEPPALSVDPTGVLWGVRRTDGVAAVVAARPRRPGAGAVAGNAWRSFAGVWRMEAARSGEVAAIGVARAPGSIEVVTIDDLLVGAGTLRSFTPEAGERFGGLATTGNEVHVLTLAGRPGGLAGGRLDPTTVVAEVRVRTATVRGIFLGEFGAPVTVATTPDYGWGANARIAAGGGTVAAVWEDPTSRSLLTAVSGSRGAAFGPASPVPGSIAAENPTLEATVRDPSTVPVARFSWSVAEGYRDVDGDGAPDPRVTALGADPQVRVTLDGCGSVAGPGLFDAIARYRWFIDGAEVAAENSCRIERMVTADVEHAVRLVVVRAGDEVEARSDQRIRPRLTVVVAMGDGVAAGEGNPLVPSTFDPSLDVDSIVDANLRPAEWQDRACHRSASAGAALAARRLEQSDRHSAVAFFHLACSGASIRSGDVVDPAGENRAATGGVLDPYQGIEPTAPTDDEGAARPSQLDQLGTLLAASGQDVDALLLSVGAADVRLDEVVRGCLSSQIGEGDGCNTPGARSAFDRRFAVLPDRFVELADALAASRPELAAHPERVVLTGYADPTPDRLGATNLRCVADAEVVGQIAAGVAAVTELIGKIGSFAPPARAFLEVLGKAAEVTALLVGGGNGLITDTEARWLSTSVYGGVNGVVRDAAAGYGWRFAGAPSAAFARAGYCSDDSRRVVRLGESLWGQAGVEGAFQPNGAGQGAYGDLLARQLALLLPPDDLAVDGSEDDAVLVGATGEYVLTFTGRADPGGPARDRLVVTDLAVRGATLETTAARRIDEVVAAPARFTGTWWQGRGVAADDRGAVVTWTQVATGPLGDTWRSLVGRAYIGRPGVAVEAVTLVQAPDNPLRLAAGRETVVRARLRARLAGPTAVPVEVTVFDGAGDVYGATHSVTLVEGLNDVVLPPGALPRPEADAVWGATVSVVDPGTGVTDLSAGSDDSLTFAAVPVAATRPISMLFAPVDGTGATCAETSTIATRAVPYARAALPVPDDGVRAAFTASALTGPGGCPAVPGTEQTKAGVLAALHDLDRLARLAGVDAVVGTVPTHWLMDTDPDSDPWGVALLGAPGNPMRGMLVESGTFDNVVTHEFAHLLGSDHSVSGDVPGLWVSRRATRQGPDYLRLGATSTRWVSPATYDATLDALGGSAPPVPDGAGPAVRLSGTIAPDGTDPVLGPWLAAAAPDPATPSRLEAVMLDAAGDELAAEPLPLAAAGADYAGPGPGPDEPEPLGYVFARAVPLAPGTATIRLDFDGTPVATRAVSATAPSVTVTAPTPGTVLATGGEVTVVWETVDPDPDPTLSHSVLLSPDGGTTWRPVATDIDASTLTFPLPAGITGDAVRVRVVSSDGVRSGVGEAGPFSVRSVRRGPERIAYTELQSALECQTGLGCDAGIHTAAPDGTDDREVLAKTASPRFAPYEPDWSPDGRRLAFAALADVAVGGAPPYDEPYYRRDIWVSDGDGANRVRITRAIESPLRPGYSTPLEFNCPDWSPDGTRISALAGLGLGEVHPYFVVSMAIDGSDLRFHGRLPARARQCPRWSPDGSMLALPYTYSTFTVPADDRPFRPDGQAWISDGSSPARNDTVVVTFPTSGSSYSATGTVFASIIGQLNSAPTLGAAWETSDTLIVAVSEGLRCGLIRVGSGVPVDDWVMDCPDPRIPNLAGTSLLRIQQFNPVGPHFAPDGRIAFTSGWYEAGSAYTFAATLCTIPADSVSAVPTLANPSFPGLSCLTYPGQTSGLPLNGALRGRREVDWSAGPVIDDDGGGGGGSGPELFLPDAAADPGGPYVLDEDTDGVLDGSASALEATAAGFAWDLDDDGEYDDAVGRQPTVRFTDAGTYPVGLRVTAGPETAFARSEVMVRAVAPVVEVPERQFSLADRATSLGPFRYRDEGTGTHVARIDVGGETFTGVVDGGSVTATVLLPAGEHAGTLTVCDAPTEPCSSVPIVIEGEERPVLSGVAPETVGAAGGAPVTLVGRHLAGTTQVVVGAQTVSATGDGPVTFTAPPGTAGSSAVVTVPGADGEATLYYADLAAVDQDLRTPRDTEILVTLEALDAVAGERVAAVHEVTTVPVHGELVTPGPGGLDDSSAVTTVADSVLYRPPVGFVGTDEFRVRVLGDARTATIRIAVGNAAPVVGADTVRVPVGQVTEVDTAVLLGNDVDPDADSSPARPSRAAAGGTGLEIAAVFAPSGMVGAVWLDAEGKLYFAAPEGASGETEFEYVAADPAGETSTGSVTVEFDGGGPTTTTTTVPVSTTSTTSTVPASTTSTTVAAPSTTAPGGSPTTVPVVVDPVRPDGSLPRTGAGVGTAVRTALVLAGFGIAFVASARKRRRTG